jgi:hypothetical protein
VHWHSKGLQDFLPATPAGKADGVLCHAFLDLVDLDVSVPPLLRLLRPGGAFWFTLTFDGVTAFLPEEPGGYEAELLRAYHRTMDERVIAGSRSGHSLSGRRLIEGLPRWGATILDAGPSDWWVQPREGGYPEDEAYFLHFMIDTVRKAVSSSPDVGGAPLDVWARNRHGQIDRGEMSFLAHQWDVAGTV